ncbi:glycosyltransferase family 2 protein [Amycolatopsis sp. NBC_01286]|uniref:glycosyltransferase family 2 protein n=1 Tax=Amycolatopsis sp. NBC_01286 TaxID=2903560 RepID=UPI002E0F7C52|nr:glycosyltransferase [Amycolatopsis sp. NBC_01286]
MISIVVTSYNQRAFIADAIGSALRQTRPPAEVVVVDDGSTDDSWQLIRAYGDSLVSIARANGGQAAAWNTAAAVTTGEWVIFLDGDDRLSPHAVEAVEEAVSGVTGAAKVHWRMRLVNEQGTPLGIEVPDTDLPRGDRLPELVEYGFDRGPNLATSANAWHTDFLSTVLPMPEEPFRISPDTYLLGLSPLYGITIAIDEVCSDYRSHEGNNGAKGSARFRAREIVRRSAFVFDLVGKELTERGHRVDVGRWKTANLFYAESVRIAEERRYARSELRNSGKAVEHG